MIHKGGRPPKIVPDEIRRRAFDVFVNLRALDDRDRERFLLAETVDEITTMYPPGSPLARKFPGDRFPAELVFLAKQHRDYPAKASESQLLFIARFIAGAGSTLPEYSLKLTRGLLDKELRSFKESDTVIVGQEPGLPETADLESSPKLNPKKK